jgi:hypothetical protein
MHRSMKGHKCQSSAREAEQKAERFLGKLSGFLLFLFLHAQFCRTHYFNFLNYVSTKIVEMDSNLFRIFYFKLLQKIQIYFQ